MYNFRDKDFLCYIVCDFAATSTAINMLKQTVVQSYISIYNEIAC